MRDKNTMRFCKWAVVCGIIGAMSLDVAADPTQYKNLPTACKQNDSKCKCDSKKTVNPGCIKVYVDMGETTPWTGSKECSLKIFADAQSPMIFTPESLYALIGGYTFKRLGNSVLSDGRTSAEVVFAHPNGENIYFEFKNGESWGQPNPGIHTKMDERLMMVDAEGWAVSSDPVYYDLYEGDGTRRRFLATNMTGELGKLVSITDYRGVVWTPEQMGVDIIYMADSVRQFLTPSRLADVVDMDDYSGYVVTVYPLQAPPAKDASTGLYQLPDTQPVMRVAIRSEKNGNRAVVSVKSGDTDEQTYIFDYLMDDWSLTRPSGVQEWKERYVEDSRAAHLIEETRSRANERMSRTEMNFRWESWGFAMTNRVEGYDGVTEKTSWTYYTSGNGKGQVKTELRQSGLMTEYAYDENDRIISERRSGPGMMTEVTAYNYESVDASDVVPPVDDRPRTIVKTLNGIECERTYYVYSPLTNIVEHVGTQGSAYGGTNVLRTVTAFYQVVAGDIRSGMVKSIRHENGKVDAYDYSLTSNLWTETVTHLHEQAPEPISGKTTRDITVMNGRDDTIETRTEAYIAGVWHVIARNRMTYNLSGKIVRKENLAGQVTTTDWDCCHKTHEIQPDGSTTTWDYDDEGRLVETSRLIPLDMTNQTWVSTRYEYDDLGRQIASWQTNSTMHVGLPSVRMAYDPLGRATNRVDVLGNNTTTTYSADGRTLSVHNPNTSTRITNRSADGDIVSIVGTAVTPEFHTYGILPDGTRWTKIVQGETAESPRFTKRYENMLGQTLREERSGFQGAVLATCHSYDCFGRLASTETDYEPRIEYSYDKQGNRIATTRFVEDEWRKTQSYSLFALDDSNIWLTQTNIVSCSDASITPLVSSEARQLTGLASSAPLRMRSTDIRGNTTEKELKTSNSSILSSQTVSYATNKPLSVSRFGIEVQDVSVSAITNSYAYDALGRRIVMTDGRGNTTRTEYNISGQIAATIDALGNRTTYVYDPFGNLAAMTNPLGNATVYEYDLRGRKTYEGGATYPVRYTYDIFGNKTTMMTYRNESFGPDSGDVTTWLYDEASGSMTNKVYADGKGPTYSYTSDGKLSQRIWARGIVTDYSYDGWGNLTNTVYSDDTPTVSLAYDVLGRQSEAHDAAGVTTFIYDTYGSLTNETVIGIAGTNTIKRYWDAYGRTAGYALNGDRQTTIGYCLETGRIESMLALGSTNAFHWTYVQGSDLKAQLEYPNGLTASWIYDAAGQLLQVCNATPTNVISQYDYTYDAAGRRIECHHSGIAFDTPDQIYYDYNSRNELTNAVSSVDAAYSFAYNYDGIGNRLWSIENTNRMTYAANQLNQYTAVDEFTPQFDDDGNQTLVKTATGVWSVIYNGENRPIYWSNGITNIVMFFDRMGRRVHYLETVDSAMNANKSFTYDNYVCIAQHRRLYDDLIEIDCFIWDPTEPVATIPLVFCCATAPSAYYAHDGNKNISELIDANEGVMTHYEYAAFGTMLKGDELLLEHSPFCFSSEYYDTVLGLTYFNYRHYNPLIGNWCARDIIEENGGLNLFEMVGNNTFCRTDVLGWGWTFRYGIPVYLYKQCCGGEEFDPAKECCINNRKYLLEKVDTGISYYCKYRRVSGAFMVLLRPLSPGQWFLSHCWFAVGNDRFGAYPSNKGGVAGQLIKGIGGTDDTIQDERKLTGNHPASEGSFLVFNTTVRLSECEYDLDKFNSCIQSKNPNNENANPKWNWTLSASNCRDFVLDSIDECKQKSKKEVE